MGKKYFYKAFGLIWSSEFPIPEFYKTTQNIPDVEIIYSNAPDNIKYTKKNVRCQLNDSELLLKFENVATYYVKDGCQIVIEKHKNASVKDVRSLLLTTIVGVVLNQRKYFPIHGSAVLVNKKAVLFSGVSGIGKSTLAASFALSGHKIISDDISAIDVKDEMPFILPSYPAIKLWPDSISELKLPENKFKIIRKGINKKKLIYRKYFEKDKVELSHVFVIKSSIEETISCKEIRGIEKFNFLKINLYRFKMIDGENNKRELFKHLSVIAKKVKLYELVRPKYPLNVEGVKNIIMEFVLGL